MRSRAELRRGLEWTLRAALITILAVALWRSLRGANPSAATLTTDVAQLGPALRRATVTPGTEALDVSVDGTLTPTERAWMVALRRAGVQVRWQGSPPALALVAERAREPVAPVRLLLVADSGSTIVLADAVGTLDTLRVRDGAATLEAADVVGPVQVQHAAFAASVPIPPRGERRDVLVLGRASWESRFVLAALTEAGWHVRARLPAAPGVAVSDAALLPIDSARYDAVVALDSSAADLAPAIARFVAQGGGLIAAGSAIGLAPLRSALPARTAARRPGRILLSGDTLTRGDLPLRPLVGLRSDAVALERQPAGLASAIRRAGRGRAAAVGYEESWRWRMQGGAAGERAHRDWWSRMVGLVAPERLVLQAEDAIANADASGRAAPRAALIAALGPPAGPAQHARSPASTRLPLFLLVLAMFALLAETASRRFRGAS
jgi:hypothetical protein